MKELERDVQLYDNCCVEAGLIVSPGQADFREAQHKAFWRKIPTVRYAELISLGFGVFLLFHEKY